MDPNTSPTAPFQIIINVHFAPDGSPTVKQLPGGDPRGDPAGDPRGDLRQDPQPPKPLDTMSVEALLAMCRVVRPADVLEAHEPDRIREVCKAALSGHRKNLGGWVATALRKGWKV